LASSAGRKPLRIRQNVFVAPARVLETPNRM
jgi:hypothetical protein